MNQKTKELLGRMELLSVEAEEGKAAIDAQDAIEAEALRELIPHLVNSPAFDLMSGIMPDGRRMFVMGAGEFHSLLLDRDGTMWLLCETLMTPISPERAASTFVFDALVEFMTRLTDSSAEEDEEAVKIPGFMNAKKAPSGASN